jgi:hypothetical protein
LESIRDDFLYGVQDFCRFYAGMAADEELGRDLGGNGSGGKDLGRKDLESGDRYESESPGRNLRANPRLTSEWEDEEHAKPLGLVITAALLFVLVAAAVLFGGRGSIGPVGRPSISGPDGKALGDFLYSMNEDASCPRASFDNATGSVAARPLPRSFKPRRWRCQSST